MDENSDSSGPCPESLFVFGTNVHRRTSSIICMDHVTMIRWDGKLNPHLMVYFEHSHADLNEKDGDSFIQAFIKYHSHRSTDIKMIVK